MSEFPNKLISVAIVEDDPMVRRVTESFLEKMEGFVCMSIYASIDEAKKGLTIKLPHLVLLDVFFAQSSGFELLHWIRENQLDTDVILITADHSTKSIEKALRGGAVDYLVKPFRFSRFEEALLKFAKINQEISKSKTSTQKDIDILMNRSKLELDDSKIEEDIDLHQAYEKDKLERNKTYRMIEDYLMDYPKDKFTAGIIGEKLGIARITARRYLDKMEEEGSIVLHTKYGAIGRPKNYYQIKEK